MPGCPATLAYSRARACCACSRCGTDGLYIFIIIIFHLSSISNVLFFFVFVFFFFVFFCGGGGGRLNMTEIL